MPAARVWRLGELSAAANPLIETCARRNRLARAGACISCREISSNFGTSCRHVQHACRCLRHLLRLFGCKNKFNMKRAQIQSATRDDCQDMMQKRSSVGDAIRLSQNCHWRGEEAFKMPSGFLRLPCNRAAGSATTRVHKARELEPDTGRNPIGCLVIGFSEQPLLCSL